MRSTRIQKATAKQSYRKTKAFISKKNQKRKQNESVLKYDSIKNKDVVSTIQPKQKNQQILENQRRYLSSKIKK